MSSKEKVLLQAQKADFVDHFLSPASKLADNLSLEITGGIAKCWAASPDNSVIFFGSCPVTCAQDVKMSIPDIKNFLRLCNAVSENVISFELTSNSLKHNSEALSFTYHLLDESFANKKGFNQEKIDSLTYQAHFVLTKVKHTEILKYNAIVQSVEKVYFQTSSDGSVHAKIGDNEKQNTNEITIQIAQKHAGEDLLTPVPIGVAALHFLTFAGDELVVSVNTQLRILSFRSVGAAAHKYLISGLVK